VPRGASWEGTVTVVPEDEPTDTEPGEKPALPDSGHGAAIPPPRPEQPPAAPAAAPLPAAAPPPAEGAPPAGEPYAQSPYAPPGYGPSPYAGPPYAGGGFGFPAQPAALAAPPRGPADPLRAVAVALLNLGGLGLGYALMRRWIAMAVCLAATAALLLVALPADPDGVPGGVVAGYLAVLVLAAAHGALRALRTPLRVPPRRPPSAPIAALLGLVLLAVPVGGALAYGSARDEATQKMLLDRLAAADALVQAAKDKPFDAARDDYRTALSAYRDLHRHHAGSRAAQRVPDRLRTYYATVGAPYARKDYCGAVQPLTYLRTVPADYGAKDLGDLARWPDDRLATSLYECGAADLAHNGTGASRDEDDFSELLTTFPRSAQAAKVAPALGASIDAAGRAVKGSDPCAATDRVKALGTRAGDLPGDKAGASAALAQDARRADGYAESGAYACGVHQYRAGDFDSAQQTMDDFAAAYPHDRNRALARKFSIAAQIAQHEPAAGKHVPTLATGGGIDVTVSNDSPDPVTVLYTGTVTGSFTLGACKGCSTYASRAEARLSACKAGKSYPHRTLHLPAGAVYFMHKGGGSGVSGTPATDSETLRYGYVYTECAYSVTSAFDL
jgi:hypothetical protein